MWIRVGVVLRHLQPVARQVTHADGAIPVLAHDVLVARQERRGLRAHVRPDQTAHLLHRIGGDRDAVAHLGRRLGRRLQTAAVRVEHPSVVGAAQVGAVGHPARERRASMRTAIRYEPERAVVAAKERQIFAHDPFLEDRPRLELDRGGNRMPETPQIVAHRRPGTETGQPLGALAADVKGTVNCTHGTFLRGLVFVTLRPKTAGRGQPTRPGRNSVRRCRMQAATASARSTTSRSCRSCGRRRRCSASTALEGTSLRAIAKAAGLYGARDLHVLPNQRGALRRDHPPLARRAARADRGGGAPRRSRRRAAVGAVRILRLLPRQPAPARPRTVLCSPAPSRPA